MRKYAELFAFALSRSRISRGDVKSLIFMIQAIGFYILGAQGVVTTPTGRILVLDRKTLRSFAYGFFKTHFAYLRSLGQLQLESQFFPIVVDVGANLGDFSFGMVSKAGQVISIEPDQENFTVLSDNVRLNKLRNVRLVKAAAHSEAAEVYLEGVHSDMYVVTRKTENRVEARTLCQIMRNLGVKRISLLKIDVQGHEISVLKGLQDMLETQSIDLMVVEVHLKRNVSCAEVTTLVGKCGYSLVHTDPYLPGQPHLYFVPIACPAVKQVVPVLIPVLDRQR